MSQRVKGIETAPELYRAVLAVEQHVRSAVDPTVLELVKLRASITNQCAFCVDMHSREALAAGESPERLFGVAAWRESPFYTPAERAALALTDAVTALGDEGVPDDVWDGVVEAFGEKGAVELVGAAALINLWNRLSIAVRSTPLECRGGMIDAVSATTLDEAAITARPRLVALAYRMLGSMSDAEDVVQDSLLKAHLAAPRDVASPVAYLTTVVTRTAIDHLRSARVRREAYVGPWLPEPVARDPAPDVSAHSELAESLSMAFLVMLESLSPEERATLLLHDVFGYSHAEVAETLDRTEAASRQTLHRARRRLDAGPARFRADRRQTAALAERFMAACEGGDVDAFLELLADDAVAYSDGGATVRAARHPLQGAGRVARFYAYVSGKGRGQASYRLVEVNGEPAVAQFDGDELHAVVTFELAGPDRIATVRWLVNPDKLRLLADELR